MNSPVVSAAEMRAAEETAFARGVTAEALMDEAAAGIARTVSQFFPAPGRCIVFAGKGNNAGDAFAATALLHRKGWSIDLRLVYPEKELGELARKKFRDCAVAGVGDPSPFAASLRPGPGPPTPAAAQTIILDGLLGLGAKPPLREPIRAACREINQLRRGERAFVFAIDIPTGLDGDSGEADEDGVIADCTIAIGFAKQGLVEDRALERAGRLEVIELAPGAVGEAVGLPSFSGETATRNRGSWQLPLPPGPAEACRSEAATATSLRHLLPPRNFGAYKNQFGRIGVVAGSKGLTGAAILSVNGALRAGAGLVELYVLEEIYALVGSAAPAEVMVKPIASYETLLAEPIDVWALGPGLGREHAGPILQLIEKASQPMVIDADGLNILAADPQVLRRTAGPRLLTPHPAEMKRIFPAGEDSRARLATRFCDDYPVTLLLKGSRTIVAECDKPLSYNTTGNPGMATGGMGDVLTGVCAALIAQKLSPYDAARLGAWVCGRAAELAIFNGPASEQSLLPSDVLANLGRAFRAL